MLLPSLMQLIGEISLVKGQYAPTSYLGVEAYSHFQHIASLKSMQR